MIGESLGSYKVIALVGSGGMGHVYRAHDARLDRDVAIKILPEAFAQDRDRLARFEREAKLLASLSHANIAAIYGFEEAHGVPFIAMELVEGPTLADRLASGPMEPTDALRIGRQIAEALEFAHDHGIVHRDLKPANVKVRPDGTAKVLDFGLAKAGGGGSESQSLLELTQSPTPAPMTQTGVILGTAPYMSPEQVRGQRADARADLWALGCVMYELFVGKGPYQRETIADTLSAVLEHEPDWEALPARVPQQVRSLLRRCLRKDPRHRLHHAADARIEIEEALSTLSGGGGQPQVLAAAGDRPAEPRTVRQRIAWFVAGTVTALAAVVASVGLGLLDIWPTPGLDSAPVRFSVSLPDGAAIPPGEVQSYVAVSPDAHYLAFVGNGSTDPVWLHSFADSTTRSFPATEGARSPFWSPDGRYIGFFAEGQLKRLDVSSGGVQVICDASFEAGDTWNEQGTILFSQPFTGGRVIHRVSADGGNPTPVSQRDSDREVGHFWPHFLPDGRHFLYLAVERSDERTTAHTLYVGSLDADDRIPLPGVASRAMYAAGRLLYVNEGVLVARPFDVDRLEFTGDPEPVSDELRYFQMTGHAEFSVARGAGRPLVAFHGRPWVSQLVTYDREGQRLGELAPPGAFDQLRIAPDGQRAAVDVLEPTNGGRDLWIYNLGAGRSPRRLTLLAADERSAAWSPDGRRIVYRSDVNGPPDLYARDADGSGDQAVLLSVASAVTSEDWSPNGDELLFRVETRPTNSDLAVLSLDSREPRDLLTTRYAETGGRFAPDGEWIAFVSDESGQSQVYVAPLGDPGARQPVSTDGGVSPRWSASGAELYYLGPDRSLMAVSIRTDPALVIGEPLRLFRLAADAYNAAFDVTPDGQLFVVNEVIEDTSFSPIHVILNWTSR